MSLLRQNRQTDCLYVNDGLEIPLVFIYLDNVHGDFDFFLERGSNLTRDVGVKRRTADFEESICPLLNFQLGRSSHLG